MITAWAFVNPAFPAAAKASRPGNPVTIGIVADVQYDREAPVKNKRHYTLGVKQMTEAVDVFRAVPELSFVANLGDITDHNYTHYPDIKAVTDRLDVPVYNVYGNHDFYPAKTAAEFRELAVLKGMRKPYYSVVKGGVRFIFLNTSDVAVHSAPKDSEERMLAARWYDDLKALEAPNAKQYNGGIGLQQLVWLEDELCKADAKGQWAIVLCHMPMQPFGARETLWNSMEVVHMLEKHDCLKAVFCGHNHRGSYFERCGVHYVNFLGMVEGENNRFAVATVDKASGIIRIKGYGDEQSRELICR